MRKSASIIESAQNDLHCIASIFAKVTGGGRKKISTYGPKFEY